MGQEALLHPVLLGHTDGSSYGLLVVSSTKRETGVRANGDEPLGWGQDAPVPKLSHLSPSLRRAPPVLVRQRPLLAHAPNASSVLCGVWLCPPLATLGGTFACLAGSLCEERAALISFWGLG